MRSTCRTFVTLALGFALCLAGCGGSQPSSAPSEPEEAEQTQEEAPAEEEPAAQELGKAQLEVGSCDYHYELKEVGTFEGDKRIPSFQQKGAIGFNDAGDPQLMGVDGKPLMDGAIIRGIEYWTDGIYEVALENDDVNNTGLVSVADGVLVPCVAATIEYATEEACDARFVEVIYATDKTDNEDECFVYATDKLVSISIDEGDTMYKGYAKVYDLQKHAFVDGVEITNGSRRALRDLGDAFVVQDEDDKYTMYDATGKEIWSSTGYADFGRHSLTYQSGGKSYIVDAKGETTFATEGYLNTLASTNDLYILQDDDQKWVIDTKGNVVLEGNFEKVTGEFDGLFSVTDGGKSMIVDGQGKALAEDLEEFSVIQALPGIQTYKNTAGKRVLFLSNGTLVEDVDGSMYDLDFYKDDSHLVISTGSYDVNISNPDVLTIGLIRGYKDSSSDKYALYDLFSGAELLEANYESINWAGGYVYAYKNGAWTVYEAKLTRS